MRQLLTSFLILCSFIGIAQKTVSDSIKTDIHFTADCKPFYKGFLLHKQQTKFGRKFLTGSAEAIGYNAVCIGLLFALPESLSNWKKMDTKTINRQYKNSFTRPPVVDRDVWYINYLGHPYQGACYYNAVRSQGAKFWQAGLFCIGHSLVWEYVLEGGMEQPSIQDLVVTPIAGSLLGELIHFSTFKMSHNGFKWYEKAFVCVFNPMFAINNGFKYPQKPCGF